MKYNTIIFSLIISFLVLSNAKVFAMIPHNTANIKTTSFGMFSQLLSNYFIKNKQEIDTTIKNKEANLTDTIKTLESNLMNIPSDTSSVEGILNKVTTANTIKNIENLWNQLSYLYVSNDFERFFNKYGPDIDELAPTVKKLRIQTHPDHKPDNLKKTFDDLSKTFNVDRREDPLKPFLKDPIKMKNLSNAINTKICETANIIINTMYHNKSMLNDKMVHELSKANTMMECNSLIQNSKNLAYLHNNNKVK